MASGYEIEKKLTREQQTELQNEISDIVEHRTSDYGKNLERFGPIDMINVKEPSHGGGEPLVKECPKRHALLPLSVMLCPECGFQFPPREREEREHEEREYPPTAQRSPAGAECKGEEASDGRIVEDMGGEVADASRSRRFS